jgi:hypothetical protein
MVTSWMGIVRQSRFLRESVDLVGELLQHLRQIEPGDIRLLFRGRLHAEDLRQAPSLSRDLHGTRAQEPKLLLEHHRALIEQ